MPYVLPSSKKVLQHKVRTGLIVRNMISKGRSINYINHYKVSRALVLSKLLQKEARSAKRAEKRLFFKGAKVGIAAVFEPRPSVKDPLREISTILMKSHSRANEHKLSLRMQAKQARKVAQRLKKP